MNPSAVQNLQQHRRPRHSRLGRVALPGRGKQVPQHAALNGAALEGLHQLLLEEEIGQMNLQGGLDIWPCHKIISNIDIDLELDS